MAYGSKSSIGATALQLTATATPITPDGIALRSDPANTGYLFVGSSSAVTAGTSDATDGFPMKPGETLHFGKSLSQDVSYLYVIASTTGQRIFWSTDINSPAGEVFKSLSL